MSMLYGEKYQLFCLYFCFIKNQKSQNKTVCRKDLIFFFKEILTFVDAEFYPNTVVNKIQDAFWIVVGDFFPLYFIRH